MAAARPTSPAPPSPPCRSVDAPSSPSLSRRRRPSVPALSWAQSRHLNGLASPPGTVGPGGSVGKPARGCGLRRPAAYSPATIRRSGSLGRPVAPCPMAPPAARAAWAEAHGAAREGAEVRGEAVAASTTVKEVELRPGTATSAACPPTSVGVGDAADARHISPGPMPRRAVPLVPAPAAPSVGGGRLWRSANFSRLRPINGASARQTQPRRRSCVRRLPDCGGRGRWPRRQRGGRRQ